MEVGGVFNTHKTFMIELLRENSKQKTPLLIVNRVLNLSPDT